MIGESEWIDESSNLSMQSAEFGELPLEKLEQERSGASFDSQLDRSKEGLNLAVSRDLKVGSNSSWSTGSQKRFRCPSTDKSVSAAKRPRTRAAGRAPGPSPSSSGFQSERKAPVNFADILRETKEINIQKREGYSSIDEPPPLNRRGGRLFESGNTFPHEGAPWSGSSGGHASWLQKCFPSKGQKDVEARQESSLSTNVSAIRQQLEAKENLSSVSARRKPRLQSQHKIKTIPIKQDDSKASQPASQEDNIIMYEPTGRQVSNSEQCKKICSDSKALRNLEAPKGINMVINVDPTISKRNTTKNQVWEMPKNAGIMIADSKPSPDFLVWGASRRSIATNLISDTDRTNLKCPSMKPAPQLNMIVPVISPPSTTPALSQGNESMSIEGTTTASVILTQSAHDCINSRTTPTPSLSLTDAIHIPLPDQPDMKQLNKQHPESQVAPSLPTLRPSIAPNRPESRIQHTVRGRGRGTSQHMGRGRGRSRGTMQHMGRGRGRGRGTMRNTGRGRGSGSANRGYFQKSGGKVFLTEHRISKRIRQLSIAKRTAGYLNYLRAVPRDQRGNSDPRTPDPTERISKRRFDGKVRVWRRRLHEWDA